MAYSGNYDADRWYDRRVNGRRCQTCGGRGFITPGDWNDFTDFMRSYKFDFKALMSYAREYSHTGEIECPECHGDGRIYG